MTGFHDDDDEYESIPNSSVGVNMLAGALAGITEHVVTYPLDVLKVKYIISFSTWTMQCIGQKEYFSNTRHRPECKFLHQ